ncbi:MAG: hypothetical protein HRT94_01555 [Alphaproteobacteria bacterium]|nr:hypothetical protein [Alphaproteobacteria bacterium]
MGLKGGEKFLLELPDEEADSNVARVPLSGEYLNDDKLRVIAQAAFNKAYMEGYFDRNGQPRGTTDQGDGIVERLRATKPSLVFSIAADIGPVQSNPKRTHHVWARRITNTPQASAA